MPFLHKCNHHQLKSRQQITARSPQPLGPTVSDYPPHRPGPLTPWPHPPSTHDLPVHPAPPLHRSATVLSPPPTHLPRTCAPLTRGPHTSPPRVRLPIRIRRRREEALTACVYTTSGVSSHVAVKAYSTGIRLRRLGRVLAAVYKLRPSSSPRGRKVSSSKLDTAPPPKSSHSPNHGVAADAAAAAAGRRRPRQAQLRDILPPREQLPLRRRRRRRRRCLLAAWDAREGASWREGEGARDRWVWSGTR